MLETTERINNYTQEREAIESRLVNNFDTSIVPVQFGNVNFLKKGNEVIPTPYKGPTFIRLSIVGGESTRPEITRTFNQVNSIIDIRIFVQMDLGHNKARQIADELFRIFNIKSFNGIITEAVSLRELPPNSNWYNMSLTVPYRWYRCIET